MGYVEIKKKLFNGSEKKKKKKKVALTFGQNNFNAEVPFNRGVVSRSLWAS